MTVLTRNEVMRRVAKGVPAHEILKPKVVVTDSDLKVLDARREVYGHKHKRIVTVWYACCEKTQDIYLHSLLAYIKNGYSKCRDCRIKEHQAAKSANSRSAAAIKYQKEKERMRRLRRGDAYALEAVICMPKPKMPVIPKYRRTGA